MHMTAPHTPKPRNALYALGSRDVRPETLKLVDEIRVMLEYDSKRAARDPSWPFRYSKESIGRAIETCVLKALNAERKELAALARELDIDAGHVEISAAASRMGPSQTADVAINACRQLFARLCAERIATNG